MATEEWIKRAIVGGKVYEDLPSRVKGVLSQSEYKSKVKEHCIQRGFKWGEGLSSTSSGEHEYYEELLRFFRHSMRLFPYHLAEYVCRVLRVTPFKYYIDLLFHVMRDEHSYDYIPNFTAADIVRVVGVGRNEYIAIMNRCKAKKLLWRMNKSVVKDYLPQEPLDLDAQPWWGVNTVNLGQTEYQQLTQEELRACTEAARPGSARVREFNPTTLRSLYKRGLLYYDVPIWPDDHVSIPPLEGFVSNKDAAGSEARGDPVEAVLYGVFVATSARASVADLADILSVDLPRLTAAISIACRLGFAKRLPNPAHDGDEPGTPQSSAETYTREGGFDLGFADADADSAANPTDAGQTLDDGVSSSLPSYTNSSSQGGGEGSDGQGIALVVDAEVTSYLMMGALSPSLKRHSVTLFEGGRVTGAEVIAEMITELFSSAETGAQFEGEMQRLASYARALATALACVRTAASGRPVELLRKESLAGLAPAAAARVLTHAYMAVVPITSLPYPPLPLSASRPGPTHYGPSPEACTPWIQLALYTSARMGPPGIVFVCGQRLWRLPPQLQAATHALIWPWNLEAVRALAAPVVADGSFLLYTLNEHLTRTAILVQPLSLPPGVEATSLRTIDIPLPLSPSPATSQTDPAIDSNNHTTPSSKAGTFTSIETSSGEEGQIQLPRELGGALESLGLAQSLGYLRMVQIPEAPADGHLSLQDESAGFAAQSDVAAEREPPGDSVQAEWLSGGKERWLPLHVQLGMPLFPDTLCAAVCRQAQAARFLSPAARKAQAEGQVLLHRRLAGVINVYGACTDCLGPPVGASKDEGAAYVELPIQNLLFDGQDIRLLDYSEYCQGIGSLCME